MVTTSAGTSRGISREWRAHQTGVKSSARGPISARIRGWQHSGGASPSARPHTLRLYDPFPTIHHILNKHSRDSLLFYESH